MVSDSIFEPAGSIPETHHPQLGQNSKKLWSYDRFFEFTPRYVQSCQSLDDVLNAVNFAASSGLRARPMGMGFSWADHVFTPDVSISLNGLNRIYKVDTDKKTIVVDAGVRLGDVSYALALHGLALPSLPFFPEMSVGGAVSSATHGTNHRWGTISDFVCSMELVLSSGEVKHLGPDSPPHELRAARVAVGMLGILIRIELQAVDMPWVRFSAFEINLNRFIQDRPIIMDRYDHLWGHWKLGTQMIKLECLETAPQPTRHFHRYVEYRNGCWEPSPQLIKLLRPGWRRLRRLIHRKQRETLAGMTPDLEASATEVRISMQYGLSLQQIEPIIEALSQSRFGTHNAGRTIELKFLKGTELSFLGPNCGRDSMLLNIWWRVPRDAGRSILQPFEQIMRDFRARPHWGKMHSAPDSGYLKAAFQNWEQFEAVRRSFDPRDMFKVFG